MDGPQILRGDRRKMTVQQKYLERTSNIKLLIFFANTILIQKPAYD